MAKYLEICLFISTKALKCVMVVEKAIKIYHWASQGGWWACVRGLDLGWLHGRGLCSFGGGVLSGPWHLIFGSRLYLSGSWELGCRGLDWLSLTCGHGLLGVLDTVAGLCYGDLLNSIGNPIRLSLLRETITRLIMLVPFYNVHFFLSIDCNCIFIFTVIVNYVVFCVMALEGLVTF